MRKNYTTCKQPNKAHILQKKYAQKNQHFKIEFK
jgi:hypothetical protein